MTLLHLKLQDLILIEKAEIEFGKGLNIITGETGSGKSAILTAVRLIAGERADPEWVRKGAALAIVEAKLSHVNPELLGDIEAPSSGPITIRREIQSSGKSRCFIEDHLVTQATLRALLQRELEMVDQSSNKLLAESDLQRSLLDTFAGLGEETAEFAKNVALLSTMKKELESSLLAEAERCLELERAKGNLQEIQDVNWQQNEEEDLDQKHRFLTNLQEITEKVGETMSGLSNALPEIFRLSHLMEDAAILDPKLLKLAESIKTASLEIDEAERFLRSYSQDLEADPAALQTVETRIGAIEGLKRRFGPTWEEVEKQKEKFLSDVAKLDFDETTTQELKEKVKALEVKIALKAKEIGEKRLVAALGLSREILEELQSLNLSGAEFEVRLTEKPLTIHGTERVEFFFSANPGTPPLTLDRCASGGELSRLLFASKLVLANKEKIQCLVFDEIDSNIGGQTAAIFGEKLKKLSLTRQVICVTHFVQVARSAMHHFAVAKRESAGRSTTSIEPLSSKQLREKEFARMVGE